MPKKVLIVVGTRPNFIKITQFEKAFKEHGDYFDYKLVHTGQHYDENMSNVFFKQLKLKAPDHYLEIEDRNPARQIGHIIIKLEEILSAEKPDLVIVVGDVNSTLAAAVVANKVGIKVAHLESGLRSFDKAMPEEHNRAVADSVADYFFVTEENGEKNLLKENKDPDAIHFVGNTMIDTLVAFDKEIMASPILEKLGVEEQAYILMTIHRPSNVDQKEDLIKLLNLIDEISKKYKVVFPIHPRTLDRIKSFGFSNRIENNKNLILSEPMDYLSFQKLIACSKLVLTDSGGIQEETTFRKVPCLTLRENTERPSTITLGTNTLMDFDVEEINTQIKLIEDKKYKTESVVPPLWDGHATERIVAILKDIL